MWRDMRLLSPPTFQEKYLFVFARFLLLSSRRVGMYKIVQYNIRQPYYQSLELTPRRPSFVSLRRFLNSRFRALAAWLTPVRTFRTLGRG